MEIVKGIHRIQAPLGDRFVCVYLLVGEEATLLVDTGLDDTPATYILPYMQENGFDPAHVRYILTSHSDFDHTAGNRAAKELFPNALLMCHRLDQAMVEDMQLILDAHYDEFKASHGIFESEEARATMLAQSRTAPVDVTLTGGETLRLSQEWQVELWHTPGHSRGHMTVSDPRSRGLVICDATLFNAVLRADGTPAFPPTYRYVDTYMATLGQFEAIRPPLLLTSHYPVLEGAEVESFLAESRRFVEHADWQLRELLKNGAEPFTMREIIEELSPKLGEWPSSASPALSQPLQGHLERLGKHELVVKGQRDGLVTFEWAV
jgi:glyoxylase-like metal-dependent hydrolase (beta-lactamase superfamily II)